MSENPFRSTVVDDEVSHDGPGRIRHRVFRKNAMSLVFRASRLMQKLREEAEVFINQEVGAANVVSITEHVGFDYAVVVWFREA